MKMHANARLSLKGRELLIERVEIAGWSLSAAAEAAGITDLTARKWRERTAPREWTGQGIALRLRRWLPTAPTSTGSR